MTRVTANVTAKTDAAFDLLKASDVNATEAVNRGVQIYAWLQSEIDAGAQVQVVSADGRVTAVKLF